MNLNEDNPDVRNEPTALRNGNNDESVIIMENDITTITIDDSIVETEDGELTETANGKPDEEPGLAEATLSEFQVIDEVGHCGSQSSSNLEEEAEVNGALEVSSNFQQRYMLTFICRTRTTSFWRQQSPISISLRSRKTILKARER